MTAPVLVSGATGFIGREIVRRLLGAGRPVVALARARGGESGAQRLAAAVGGLPDRRRLAVVEADFTEPGLGLSRADFGWLRETVEIVIHCAGNPTFAPRRLAPFRAGHIDGPLALLHALHGGRLRRWAHLSTAYVCGRRSGIVLERDGDVGQEFHNVYERVKLESESAMRRGAASLGIDLRILRPSIVVGTAPETAGGNPANLFFRFIKLIAALSRRATGGDVRLRIEALPHAPFNIVPLEYVAAAAVALAEDPDAAGGAFHLVVSEAPTQAAMLAMLTERLGARGLSLVDSRRAPLEDPSPLEAEVRRLLAGYRAYLEQDVRFDDRHARRLLDRRGVAPAALSGEAVHGLVDRALFGPAALAEARP